MLSTSFASVEDLCALPKLDQRVHMCIDFTAYPYLLKIGSLEQLIHILHSNPLLYFVGLIVLFTNDTGQHTKCIRNQNS